MTNVERIARFAPGRIPAELLNNEALNSAIEGLPSNYSFEIHKTIWQIISRKCKKVGLQFPEGLLLYSCLIADIIERFTDCEVIIFMEVTYGACCVDDFTAEALGCDLLVHYGHSCLIPIQETSRVAVMYVFVEIRLDTVHLIDTVKTNFKHHPHLALCSTVQFVASLQAVKQALSSTAQKITIPQCKPLSSGEVLGCTSPKLPADVSAVIFVGDGRFHIESVMIANPSFPMFRYDPYTKECTREYYDHERMLQVRQTAINTAAKCQTFGLVLSGLGRQGSTTIFHKLKKRLVELKKEVICFLFSEVTLDKLKKYPFIESWIHVSCPRLSVDWGAQFEKPLLNPYEASVMLGLMEWRAVYPMDYYAADGPWNNRPTRPLKARKIMPRQHINVEFEQLSLGVDERERR